MRCAIWFQPDKYDSRCAAVILLYGAPANFLIVLPKLADASSLLGAVSSLLPHRGHPMVLVAHGLARDLQSLLADPEALTPWDLGWRARYGAEHIEDGHRVVDAAAPVQPV